MKHLTIDALEFNSGHRMELAREGSLINVRGEVPCDELDDFIRALRKARTPKDKITRKSPIPAHWELKWKGKPDAYAAGSFVFKVAMAAQLLAKKPIARGELQAKIAKRLRATEKRVQYTIATLVHKEKAFAVTEVTYE